LRKLPDESTAQWFQRALREAPAHNERVIDLLMQRYRIRGDDPQRWRKLTFALADEYVRAMTITAGPGRPAVSAKDVARFQQVATHIANGKTERQACSIVCKRDKKEAGRLRTAFQRWHKIPS
jgi:hypothetical protein